MSKIEIQTTPQYWDCECRKNYIHHSSEIICKICKSEQSDSPDSRIDEIGIDEILYPNTPKRNAYILQELINYIEEEKLKSFVMKIVSESK